jgi:apolipoprotein N-acyltransferase
VKLVPFSEHIPYEEKVGLLDKIRRFVREHLSLDISDFEPGDSILIFNSDGVDFGTLICFEVVYPEFVRREINAGAEFLAVITNDAWFGKTAGPMGRIVARSKLGERIELTENIGERLGSTMFIRHGLVLSQICLAVTLVALLFFLVRKRRHE